MIKILIGGETERRFAHTADARQHASGRARPELTDIGVIERAAVVTPLCTARHGGRTPAQLARAALDVA
ncbi:hypothetical protein [Nannocystis sp.]|uniref:hypothetical protein n=1 Tax=Nannocystis sp. TaxID=1962667 RepID=UPI0025E5B380|nr:hypothetical protein [Nannocystis sp.]MBK7828139.1 hypothetical protein [Nannocystis sp.]